MQNLQQNLEDILLSIHSDDSFRQLAAEKLRSIGLPKKGKEPFAYLPLDRLYKIPLSLPLKKEKDSSFKEESSLVFINGSFCKESSSFSEEIICLSLQEAEKNYGHLLKEKFARISKESAHPFLLLNQALYQEGLFLYIPASLKLEKPLKFIEIYTEESSAIYSPKVLIFLGKKSQLQIIHEVQGSFKGVVNRSMDIHLEAESRCEVQSSLLSLKEGWYLDHTRAFLKKGSFFKTLDVDAGASCFRKEILVELLEEEASTELKGISIPDVQKHSHHHVTIRHLAPYCKSHQHYKMLLFDYSKASFEGKIWVDSLAQKTEAYQLCNQLIFSEQAAAYTKPNLEIFADDVKASHGATISQLREEELFYLRARGLHKNAAQKVLVQGFCQEITQNLIEPFRQVFERDLYTLLARAPC